MTTTRKIRTKANTKPGNPKASIAGKFKHIRLPAEVGDMLDRLCKRTPDKTGTTPQLKVAHLIQLAYDVEFGEPPESA